MLIRELNQPTQNQGPRRAVLYARVSSKEQERGYSVQSQVDSGPPYAAQQNILIQEEFIDVETARKPGRPGFERMMTYLRKNPECRIILVEKTDRLYRNLGDAASVEEMGVEVHFIKTKQILSKASSAADKHRHGQDVLDAKKYVDNLSEEVKKGMRAKAEQGLWPSFASLGYRNATRDDGKRIIVPDPVIGPLITNLFQWFATGEYSVKRLASKGYEEGFRFRKSGDKVAVGTLHKVLRNRIYMGEFDYGGRRYQGTHEPLVTRELWDRVQEILDGRNKKKNRKVTHDFAYTSMVRCGHCGCLLVGEVKKRRYVYYHCTGYRGKCGEPYTREEVLTGEFAKALWEVVLPPEILLWLETALREAEKPAQAARAQLLRHHQLELERLQRRQEIMYEDRLDGRIDASTYDHKMAEIKVQREQLQRRIAAAEAERDRFGNQPADLATAASDVDERFLEQTATEQRKMLHVVLQQASWKDGKLQVLLREPFEAFRVANQARTHLNQDGVTDGLLPTGQAVEISTRDSAQRGGDASSEEVKTDEAA